MRKKALAALFGSLVAFVLAETAARVLPGSHHSTFPRGVVRSDALLGWALRGGVSGRHRSPYFDLRYEIDSEGHRDLPPVQSGGPAVAFFGDSFVFGRGVPLRSRFVAADCSVRDEESPGSQELAG